MSDQLKAIIQLANTPALKNVLLPHVDETKKSVMWESVLYDGPSHSQKIALGWAYALWRDEKMPYEVNLETRTAILRAFATRHGFTHFEIDASEPPLHEAGSLEARQAALLRNSVRESGGGQPT